MIYYWGYPGGYPATGPYGSYGFAYLWGAYTTYGTLKLSSTSPPQSFVEPLTLTDVKEYLKIPQRSPADPIEDAYITQLIAAARSWAEKEQGRDLVRKQWDLVYDYWMSYRIELPPVPLVSVDLVQYKDWNGNVTTMTQDVDYIIDYEKEPGAILAPYNQMWPTFCAWPSSAVLIRFTSGYDPNDPWWLGDGMVVKNGMRYLISNWYNRRLPSGETINEWPLTATASLEFGARRRVY